MTQRVQIRDWLLANLVGSQDAGSRVMARQALPLAKDLEPTLVFTIRSQRSTDIDMNGTQERVDLLRVTACVKGTADETEDVLDRLGMFVEDVLGSSPQLGGLIAAYEYQSTEFSHTGDGEKTLCTAAFTFSLTYYTDRAERVGGTPLGLSLMITKLPDVAMASQSQPGSPLLSLTLTRTN